MSKGRPPPNKIKNEREKKKMEKNVRITIGDLGFSGLLTIAFIVLKLCKVISWSWWWVISPLWISCAFAIIILLITLIVVAIANR